MGSFVVHIWWGIELPANVNTVGDKERLFSDIAMICIRHQKAHGQVKILIL